MNLTGLIQKSGSSTSILPQIRNESDILNMFLTYLSKYPQWWKERKLKNGDVNLSAKSQIKLLNNKNSVQDIKGIDFRANTVWKMNLNKNSIDIDKYFISNNFSQSSKVMNTAQRMNEKSSYFSKN
jgi:hypothetical protein